MRPRFSKGRVEFRLSRADDLALSGAAYVLTERAYVALDSSGRARTVVLWPKPGAKPKELAEEFSAAYENQLLRWKLLRLNLKTSSEFLQRALALAARESSSDGVAAESGLSQERLGEIAAALAEAKAEAWDPDGIARPWEELRKEAP